MKKILTAITLLIISAGAYAQILTPVQWSYAAKKVSKTEAVILLKATIDEGWHIYSTKPVDGPVKTTFTFKPSKDFTLVGKTAEPKPITKYEKVFKTNVSYFENTVVFQQRIKIKPGKPVAVKGTLEYMTCDDHQCLPPETVNFSVTIK
jgi:DsbC/DsbD-like thiol-disulfide interchange protein